MVVRSSLLQDHIESVKESAITYKNDLIITSFHGDCSPLCLPHQNKILSTNGLTPGYPKLDDAIADGYHHPNCRHLDFPYIRGITKKAPRLPKETIRANYKRRLMRNKQRILQKRSQIQKK